MLTDLLHELDLVTFPLPSVKEVAERRNVQTAEELQTIIEYERNIADVGDRLTPELRKCGAELRRATALKMLKSAGKLPADYT